jgi:hypothetical protein
MANTIYARKQKFQDIAHSMEAIEFHAARFAEGDAYPLSKECFQFLKLREDRTVYQVYLDEAGGKDADTKS